MVASTKEELHAFAVAIGVNKCWYSNPRGKCRPHYDVAKSFFEEAVAAGAFVNTRKEIFQFLLDNYKIKNTL